MFGPGIPGEPYVVIVWFQTSSWTNAPFSSSKHIPDTWSWWLDITYGCCGHEELVNPGLLGWAGARDTLLVETAEAPEINTGRYRKLFIKVTCTWLICLHMLSVWAQSLANSVQFLLLGRIARLWAVESPLWSEMPFAVVESDPKRFKGRRSFDRPIDRCQQSLACFWSQVHTFKIFISWLILINPSDWGISQGVYN